MPLLTAPKNILEVIAGSSLDVRFTFTDAADGSFLDLTGATVYLTAQNARGEKVIRKVSTNPEEIEVPAPREGYCEVHFVPGDTQRLKQAELEYDCWVVTGTGERLPVVPKATLRVLPAITEFP